MIESLFVMLFFSGLILFILGIEKESIVYNIISLLLFGVLFAQSLYITVPFMTATNVTNFTVRDHPYSEYGLSTFCLIFILADLVIIIVEFMDKRKRQQGPYIPGR